MLRQLVSTATFALVTASCATMSRPTTSGVDLPLPATVNEVRVDVDGLLRTRGWPSKIAGLRGAATNTSDQPLKFCTVTFEILDPAGAKIGNATATTTHLGPGSTWRFDAYNAGTIPTTIGSIRIADVSTDQSIIAGFQQQAVETGGLNRDGLIKMEPGKTTMAKAVQLLGAEPMSKNHQPDGSTVAMWTHTLVKGANVKSSSAMILFDAEGTMVRIVSESNIGN